MEEGGHRVFIHRGGLEYLLPTDWYHSPTHHRIEVERLFRPKWHLVGSKSDLRRNGDFRTMELLGEPLLLYRLEDEYHAFLNVCSHRHSQITDKPQGRSPQVRCQYHGWEYSASGRVHRIPEARGFRPLEREGTELHKFRLETCGDLLFVNLSDDGPDLREFLGGYHDVIAGKFSDPWRQNWAVDLDFDANWKVPVENTLESYHLVSVHKGAFGTVTSTEEAQEHVLTEDFSTLRYDVGENLFLGRTQKLTARLIGVPSTNIYTHHLIHPNFVLTVNDFLCHAQSYWPVTPTTSRTMIRMYSYRPPAGARFGRKVVAAGAASVGRTGNRKIQAEDALLFAPTQRGLTSSRRRGRLSNREERVHAFLEYVLRRCATESPLSDPAVKDPSLG
jgi:phenylpropionate dioxygenase-like ring-hydroxylating dioxygenase large terminal subunit